MPIDPSIPLAAADAYAQAWNPQRTMQMLEFSQQMRQNRQQRQNQNALRTIFSDPTSMGPDGQMSADAVARVMQVDPKTGMALREQKMTNDVQRSTIGRNDAQASSAQTEQTLKKQGYLEETVRGPALIAYDKAIKAGIPPAQAAQVAQTEFTKGLDAARASGLFSEEEQDRFPKAFDYERTTTNSKVYKDYQAGVEKKAADDRADKKEAETERRNRALEAEAARREGRIAAAIEKGNGKPPTGYQWSKEKPGELEPIPGGPATKAGSTVGGKMNPAMRASVELDVKEIQYGLDQIGKLKADTASGFFADEHEGNAVSRWFKRKITPDQQQEYDTMANRFAMAIASIQSMGRGTVSDAKIDEAKRLVPVPGDTRGNVDTKLKTIKRIVDLARESLNTPLSGGDRSDGDSADDDADVSFMWKR